MKVILFGPPGVGKSHVGQLLAQECGLTFYDGDTDYTPEEKQLLANGQWNDKHRRAFLTRIAQKINRLDFENETGVAVPIAMTRQWMRDLLQELCGPLNWVLVKTPLSLDQLEEKVASRQNKEGHLINIEAFRRFTSQFETPTMPHLSLENPHDSTQTEPLKENIHIIWQQINQI